MHSAFSFDAELAAEGAHKAVYHADMSELNLAKGTTISFPDGKDKLLHFEIFLKPEDGIYK